MTDEEFVCAFESATLQPADFPHRAHVRAAWWYLRHAPLSAAMGRFIASLQRFAAAHGKTGLYHETITVAWLLLVAERLADAPDLEWDSFAARHPELFEKPSLLARYYRSETLTSERAKRGFVMPDRVGGDASIPALNS